MILHLMTNSFELMTQASLIPNFSSVLGVFCALAWFSTLLALIFFLMQMLGIIDLDGGFDVPSTGDASASLSSGFFSVYALIGFLLGFGWGGYISMLILDDVFMASIIALGVGVLMFFVIAIIFQAIGKLDSDGTLDTSSLIGKSGQVYVSIPSHGEMGGQVQISHPNQHYTLSAIQEGDSELPAATPVIVTKAMGRLVTVEPLYSKKN